MKFDLKKFSKIKFGLKKEQAKVKSTGNADSKFEIYNEIISKMSGILVAVIVVIFVVFIYYSKDLPDPNKLSTRGNETGTKLLDRNGNSINGLI